MYRTKAMFHPMTFCSAGGAHDPPTHTVVSLLPDKVLYGDGGGDKTYHDVVEQAVTPVWGYDAGAVRPESAPGESDFREDAADKCSGLGDERARAADFRHVGNLQFGGARWGRRVIG